MTAIVAQIIADAFARYRAAEADKGAAEAPAEPSPIARLMAHPQWHPRDAVYLIEKGYSPEEILRFWARDHAQGAAPQAWDTPEAIGKWERVTGARRFEIVNGRPFILPVNVFALSERAYAGEDGCLGYRGVAIYLSDDFRTDEIGFYVGPFVVNLTHSTGDMQEADTLEDAMALIDRGRWP